MDLCISIFLIFVRCVALRNLELLIKTGWNVFVLFESLSRTVICTRELISIYMCYSQGDGLNTSLSRLFYLVYCTQGSFVV